MKAPKKAQQKESQEEAQIKAQMALQEERERAFQNELAEMDKKFGPERTTLILKLALDFMQFQKTQKQKAD